MKKLLFSIGLCMASLVGGVAQNFNNFDVMNVRALQIGTNGYWITNLANLVTNIGMTYNTTNLFYTNNAGVYVGFDSSTSLTNYLAKTGTTNPFSAISLFKDIPLWTDRNGNPILYEQREILAGAAGATTNLTYLSHETLFLEYVNPQATNAAFGIGFRPIWDGQKPSTQTGYDWWVVVSTALVTKGTLATNVPSYKWPGAKALRVIAITNNLAANTPATNSTFITELSVNGFLP